MFKKITINLRLIPSLVLMLLLPALGFGLNTRIGPYKVTLTSKPATLAVGSAIFTLTLRSADGKSIGGAHITALTQMPTMPMGEKSEPATPGAEAGTYQLPAHFAMAGAYAVNLTIDGSLGHAQGSIPIATGENLGAVGNPSSPLGGRVLLVVVLIALLLVIMVALVRAFGWRQVFAARNCAAVIILIGCILAGKYILNHFQKPGAISPIDAMTMSMDMPPPPGAYAVTAFRLEPVAFAPSVTYPATVAVSHEAVIAARVSGVIQWMPYYPGDRVQTGQLLAKLDPSSLQPEVTGANAGVAASQSAVATAQANLNQSQDDLVAAQTKIQAQIASIAKARLAAKASAETISESQAELAMATASVKQAEATVTSNRRELEYRTSVEARNQALLNKGFVSQQSVDEDSTKTATAKSAFLTAQSALVQAHATVKARESSVRVATLQAQVSEAEIRALEKDKATLTANLNAQKSVVAARESEVKTALANQVASVAAATQAETNLGYTEISSPIAGVVTQRALAAGSLATPGQTILVIAPTGYLRVQAEVTESDLRSMRVGSPVRVLIGPGRSIAAKLTVVPPTADAVTRLGMVEAEVPFEGSGLKPGDFVRMQIFTAPVSSQLCVPTESLQGNGSSGSEFVWKIDPSTSTVSRSPVQIGPQSGNLTEVISGLASGDEIVVEGAGSLHDGDAVTVGKVAQPTPQASPDLHPNASQPPSPQAAAYPPSSTVKTAMDKRVEIKVSTSGFSPALINLPRGSSSIWFLRTTNNTCATSVVFPSLHLNQTLPLGKLVEVKIPPGKRGAIRYQCGMGMFHGQVNRP